MTKSMLLDELDTFKFFLPSVVLTILGFLIEILFEQTLSLLAKCAFGSCESQNLIGVHHF